jgi:tRNA A-37 threonylcarbamoyl transferase component Bud32
LVGQTLGQYRIEGVLGQGGMGVVYRAQDLRLQRPVALKLLGGDVPGDATWLKRFFLEARAAARINHPSIAQVYDVAEYEGTAYIAMELVEGKTVRDLIQSGELDLLGTIEIATQVAEGLASAHDKGIIHRDIKPANVIVTADSRVKILDFGLAKLTDPGDSTVMPAGGTVDLTTLTQTQVGAVKGTAAYMSPEQVKGQEVSARSDLFSLGVMLFEMASGQLPFRRDTPMETMHAVAFDETPSLHAHRPNLPGELQRIVSRCLRKDPAERYADARALIQDLRVLRRDTETGTAQAPSLGDRLRDALDRARHLRRSEYGWVIGGLLALAGVSYLMIQGVGFGQLLFFAVVALLLFRFVKNHPRRMLDLFVRKVAKIPEVSVIVCQDRRLIVGVDRASGQLYGRINKLLNECNHKLFFGQPLSMVVQHELTPEALRLLLASPGVQYVRDDLPDQTRAGDLPLPPEPPQLKRPSA